MGDRLYNLLPAVYRIQDASRGEPLRALLDLIDEQVLAPIEAEILMLRDASTIETAPDWAIPYLGDLLGVRSLRPGGPGNLRGYVANTLAYRRRKGTSAALEQLARDVTALPARVVEFFQLLATTANDDHVRLGYPGTLDVRDAARLQQLGGPFETAPYTVDVRRPGNGGRYNLPHVGIFLWRLSAFAVVRGDAFRVGAGQFTFDPLGLDAPLFNQPQTEAEITGLATPRNVPDPLRRLALHAELEALRAGEGKLVWFGDQPVLRVFEDDQPDSPALDSVDVFICNLADWRRPASGAAVDPELGRIALPAGQDPQRLVVSYSYGFGGDLGASPAPRPAAEVRPPTWQVGVSLDHSAAGQEMIYTSLADAVQDWNALEPGHAGVIAIMDSRTHDLGNVPLEIEIKAGSQLLIVGAQWPAVPQAGAPGTFVRLPGRTELRGVRPCLAGSLAVKANGRMGRLILDGLLLSGGVQVAPGDLDGLALRYCTLVPRVDTQTGDPLPSLAVKDCLRLAVTLERCVAGPLVIVDDVASLAIADSLLALPAGVVGLVVDAPLSPASITAATLVGDVRVRSLTTSDSLYAGKCTVQRRQAGCARFSYLGAGSRTPRRYRCQPDLALAARAADLGVQALPPPEAELVENRLRPVFLSTRYGDPGFGMLQMSSAAEIRTGSEGGAEMGAFGHRKLAVGEANLWAVLDEYLPFGLQAGVFYRS